MVRWRIVIAFAAFAFGCGSDDEPAPVIQPPPSDCAPDAWRSDDGACVSAGLPADMPCPPGEWLRDDGTCIPAGVPSDGCGEGFAHDGDRGCEPILPSTACPPGLMAVPGDSRCREVAPCAAGTWGDIPIEPDNEYVDASYAGMDSDGSALKPWTSIQAAVDAAAPGAIIAIAAASYVEDVTVSGKPVRLWGVCPALVEVVGTGTELAAVQVLANADATEVRSLAIRGDAIGVVLTSSLGALLERVWVHDNAGHGVDVAQLGSITLRGTLVEQNHEIGVAINSSNATLEASVVRNTQANVQGLRGRGVNAQSATGAPSSLLLRGTLIEQSHEMGVAIDGSDATLEASVVRNVQPDGQGFGGRGVIVQSTTGAPSSLLLRTSLVEQCHDVAVFIESSDATLEASVVRNTQPSAQGFGGRGVAVQSATGAPSSLLLRTSLVEQSREIGVSVNGSDATVEASVVRDTSPNAQALFGRGLSVQSQPTTGAPSSLVLRSSLVERSHEIGVSIFGSEATIEASIVRDTQAAGWGGRGVHVQTDMDAPSTLLLYGSLVEQNREASVAVVDSVATIESCLLRETHSNAEGHFGDGVLLAAAPGPASARLIATRIDNSERAAVSVFGATGAMGGSLLTCQAFDLDYQVFEGNTPRLEDLGGNRCGCPDATELCKSE
jgi:hypothetical protein